jgi:hypothetical protein
MRIFPLLAALLFSSLAAADCLPFSQAHEHIGESQCITGKVLRVERGARGVTYFDFCEDFRVCPFSVVIFPGHLKDIGDVRQLANKVVEIHGTLKEYDGRAEIVLDQFRQLGGAGLHLPRLPKEYDVEKKGHNSAGSISFPKTYTTTKKRQTPKLPADIPSDGPSEQYDASH